MGSEIFNRSKLKSVYEHLTIEITFRRFQCYKLFYW